MKVLNLPLVILISLKLSLVSLTGAAPALAETLPARPPIPADNPQSPAKVALGRQLFFDRRLSKAGNFACVTCHHVQAGGEDGLPVSIKPDGKPARHSTPTVWNAAYLSTYFWYGAAASLEEQAEGPLEEMGLGDAEVSARNIAKIPGYQSQFLKVFGEPDSVSLKHVTQALAAYERTLVTPDSPYDRFVRGDGRALGPAARRGLRRFETLGCVSCHSGPVFAGPALPPGEGFFRKFPVFSDPELEARYHFEDDPGRFRVTQKEEDRHVFRVAPLRGIALTGPYFHNGSVKTLNEAVRVMARTQLGVRLEDSEVRDLVAFLRSLTGIRPKQPFPRLPAAAGQPTADRADAEGD